MNQYLSVTVLFFLSVVFFACYVTNMYIRQICACLRTLLVKCSIVCHYQCVTPNDLEYRHFHNVIHAVLSYYVLGPYC